MAAADKIRRNGREGEECKSSNNKDVTMIGVEIGFAANNGCKSLQGIRSKDVDYSLMLKRSSCDAYTQWYDKVDAIIKRLMRKHGKTKTGRTIEPSKRAANYAGYKKMYVVAFSTVKRDIERLETRFNNKYKDVAQSDNINGKSGGPHPTCKDGYYLYIVVRG